MTQKEIEDVLRGVVHPAKDKDIVSLEMVEDIKVEDGKIRFKLVFPSQTHLPALSSRVAKRPSEKLFLQKITR